MSMAAKRRSIGTGRPVPAPSSPAPRATIQQQALALWSAGQHAKALSLLQKAVRRSPNSPDAVVNLARAYCLLRDYGRASECVDTLLRKWSYEARVQHAAG